MTVLKLLKKIVTKELSRIKMSKNSNNITKMEKDALKDLQTDKSIVIKQADKRGSNI